MPVSADGIIVILWLPGCSGRGCRPQPSNAPSSFARHHRLLLGADLLYPAFGKSIKQTIEATSAPTTCATMNAGTWFMAMPAKVVVKPRASVTAGLANDVDEVNQYAAVITRPTSHGIAWGA